MKRQIGAVIFLAANLLLIPSAGLGSGYALAAPSPPPTLTGESFNNLSTGNTNNYSCNPDHSGTFTFTASGTATGPYAGPYTESGTATVSGSTVTDFSASFTIHAPTGTVTGTKTFSTDVNSLGYCVSFGRQEALAVTTYQATISTASGTYRDQGTATAFVVTGLTTPDSTSNDEQFTSSLTQPILIEPTSKDQCKNGGYVNFPQFSSQGQCVAYVEHAQGGS